MDYSCPAGQVFPSTSTVIFQTFSCDTVVIEGQNLLRADYRLSCDTTTHFWFEVYAGVMVVVSAHVSATGICPFLT